MRKVMAKLRTFPQGMDKPYEDLPNLGVIVTRLVRNVDNTGLDVWVGVGRLHPSKERFSVGRVAHTDIKDYDIWFRTEVLKHVFGMSE